MDSNKPPRKVAQAGANTGGNAKRSMSAPLPTRKAAKTEDHQAYTRKPSSLNPTSVPMKRTREGSKLGNYPQPYNNPKGTAFDGKTNNPFNNPGSQKMSKKLKGAD